LKYSKVVGDVRLRMRESENDDDDDDDDDDALRRQTIGRWATWKEIQVLSRDSRGCSYYQTLSVTVERKAAYGTMKEHTTMMRKGSL
jgi:hypothetical protein